MSVYVHVKVGQLTCYYFLSIMIRIGCERADREREEDGFSTD